MRKSQFISKLFVLLFVVLIGMYATAFAQQSDAQKPEQSKSEQRNLAILLFDGVQIIDYTGPFEVFGATPNAGFTERAFNVYTVAEKNAPITTAMGMSVNPKYTFETAPKPDILLVPGGGGSREGTPGVGSQLTNAIVIKWIQEKSKDAEIVMSVCNGAFILAKAGLLDGQEATTTSGGHLDLLRQAAPKTRVVEDKRFVDNGKIITTSGLSSGIDGALHVVEKLYGKGHAQFVALGMEYNWNPDSNFARAALADKYMLFRYEFKGKGKSLNRSGDRSSWENKWEIVSESSATELFNSINDTLANNKTYAPSKVKWTRQQEEKAKSETRSLWKFTDEKGSEWRGVMSVEAVAGEKNKYLLTVKIERVNQ
jgi:putative intracellular protease/amidase